MPHCGKCHVPLPTVGLLTEPDLRWAGNIRDDEGQKYLAAREEAGREYLAAREEIEALEHQIRSRHGLLQRSEFILDLRGLADKSLSRAGWIIVIGVCAGAVAVVLAVLLSLSTIHTLLLASASSLAPSVLAAAVLLWRDDQELIAPREALRELSLHLDRAHAAAAEAERALNEADARYRRAKELSERRREKELFESNLQRERQAQVTRERREKELFESKLQLLLQCDWQHLTGIPFEDFLADVLRHHGHDVETTKTSCDQGIDLLVTIMGGRIAVQAKGYLGGSVGNGAVQEAHAGMTYYSCQSAVVITNSTFTKAARDLAASVRCTLIDGTQIPDLIRGIIRL